MTIAFSPTAPYATQTITLSLSSAVVQPSEVLHRWELTTKPTASLLTLGELVDRTGASIATFVPDVAGTYGVSGYRYSTSYVPAAFARDRGTSRLLNVLEVVETATVEVGLSMDMLITGASQSLTFRVVSSNGLATAVSLVKPTSAIASTAIASTTVVAALAALVGATVATMGPSFVASVEDLRGRMVAHYAKGSSVTVHLNSGDTTNVVARTKTDDATASIDMINSLRLSALAHLAQSTATGAVGATSHWHTADDGKNVPIAAAATDRASAMLLLCDMRQRFYERHRVQIAAPAAHSGTDTNALGISITLLESLIVAVLDVFASASPTVPTGEPASVVNLGALYGFKVAS